MLTSSSMPAMTCDFCMSQPARWLYVSAFGFLRVFRSGDGSPVLQTDDGRWAACPDCAPLVEGGDVAALVERALDGVSVRTGLPLSAEARDAFAALYEQHFTVLLALPMVREPLDGSA